MANGSTNGWSKERDEQLRVLALEGLSTAKIAEAMGGVSRNAVIGRGRRLGISLQCSRGHQPKQPRPPRVRKSRAKYPPPAPPVELAPPPDGGIDIMALYLGVCRWPFDTADEVRYCGGETMKSRVYCPQHHKMAVRPGANAT